MLDVQSRQASSGRTAARLTEGWCGNPNHGRLEADGAGPPYCPACGCRWQLQDEYRAKLVIGEPGARVERPVYLFALDWAGSVLAECEVQHLATCARKV
jgi:hypothetical protein